MPRSFTRRLFLFYAGWALLQVPAFFSQVPKTPTPQKGPGIPDGGTREVLVSIFIPSLPGAPFTATVNTEWIRALPDGTRITLKNHRLIARDKSGRIFQERRLLVPEDSKQESIVTQIEISDPVLHEQYICVPRESVCQWEGFHPVEYRLGAMDRTAANSSGPPNQESLGTQSIAGLKPSVQGT